MVGDVRFVSHGHIVGTVDMRQLEAASLLSSLNETASTSELVVLWVLLNSTHGTQTVPIPLPLVAVHHCRVDWATVPLQAS